MKELIKRTAWFLFLILFVGSTHNFVESARFVRSTHFSEFKRSSVFFNALFSSPAFDLQSLINHDCCNIRCGGCQKQQPLLTIGRDS